MRVVRGLPTGFLVGEKFAPIARTDFASHQSAAIGRIEMTALRAVMRALGGILESNRGFGALRH